MNCKVLVAIDGPAGVGKSSVARGAAEATGYIYIDTGAMYRAVAYRAMKAGMDVDKDANQIADLVGRLEFEFRSLRGEQRLFVDGEGVSEAIRTREVGNLSSPVSAIPRVRKHLVAAQRQMASGGGAIMEGRDIGTVVLPNAQVKAFLTASPQERARRRQKQLQKKSVNRSLESIIDDIRQRDERDTSRPVAPLKKAEDAIEIITDDLTESEVVQRIVAMVQRAEGEC